MYKPTVNQLKQCQSHPICPTTPTYLVFAGAVEHLVIADFVHELETLQRLLDVDAHVLLRQGAGPEAVVKVEQPTTLLHSARMCGRTWALNLPTHHLASLNKCAGDNDPFGGMVKECKQMKGMMFSAPLPWVYPCWSILLAKPMGVVQHVSCHSFSFLSFISSAFLCHATEEVCNSGACPGAPLQPASAASSSGIGLLLRACSHHHFLGQKDKKGKTVQGVKTHPAELREKGCVVCVRQPTSPWAAQCLLISLTQACSWAPVLPYRCPACIYKARHVEGNTNAQEQD